MQKDLGNYRKSYEKGGLFEEKMSDNPLEAFRDWFLEADNHSSVEEPNAMTLSTLGIDGFPKGRVVLLKKFTDEGFIFYTNYNSEKGLSIQRYPKVSASFFWPVLERQIIIKGEAEKIAKNLSDGYFESRPRGSQLGAHASPQSSVVPSRNFLEAEMQALEKKYEGSEVPRPAHWGGFIIKPVEMEFWQGRPNRLHDRIRYRLQGCDWKKERLAP